MSNITISKSTTQTYPQFFEELLKIRGLTTDEERDIFLHPDYIRDTHDAKHLKDIGKAASRIWEAVEKKERVLIFADYDADGVCAAAILSEFFRIVDFPFGVYMPDRSKEGHGLNAGAIEQAIHDKVDLLITLDCGITGTAEVEQAKNAGIDVIIVDHHQVVGRAPAAYAIVNPHQEGDAYPFKGLCGAGLSFKLFSVLCCDTRFPRQEGHEKWLLDLVALATVADMVPMVGENRVFVKYGLFVLAQGKRPGLAELCAVSRITPFFDAANLETNISEMTLGFVLGPRVNAASRVTHAALAYDLLVSKDRRAARAFALELEENNEKRKKEVSFIEKELSARVSEGELDSFIVEGSEVWPVPLLGLVAGRLEERTGRPVLLAHMDEELSRASLRAPEGFDLMSALESVKEWTHQFGGHAQAAGCSFKMENFGHIKDGLVSYATSHKTQKVPHVWDVVCHLEDISLENAQLIQKLAPFGQENRVPRLCVRDVIVLETILMGKEGNHARVRISDKDGVERTAVIFFHNGEVEKLNKGERYSFVGELSVNVWKDVRSPQYKVISFWNENH